MKPGTVVILVVIIVIVVVAYVAPVVYGWRAHHRRTRVAPAVFVIARELGVHPDHVRAWLLDNGVPHTDLRIAAAPDREQRRRAHAQHNTRKRELERMREYEEERERLERMNEAAITLKIDALRRGEPPGRWPWEEIGRVSERVCWSCHRPHTGSVWCPHCSAPVDPSSYEARGSARWANDPRNAPWNPEAQARF